ncbi:hypothetical protein Aduo_013685 [Ancylostoma duodenale]
MRTTDSCCVCGHGPLRLSHLYDHLLKQHKWDEGQIDLKKVEYNQKKNAGKEAHKCGICGRIYRTNGILRRHRQEAHAVKVPSGDVGCVICPKCGLKFSSNFDLALHCSEHHYDQINGQDYAIISGEFASKREFELWKESLEASTSTVFSKRSSNPFKGGRKHYYMCEHARGVGADENSEGLRKMNGRSKRIQSHCPAFLKVSEYENGTVQYEGCVGHIGHVDWVFPCDM